MPHFRFLAALLLAGALACSASTAASAGILIQIDKRAQTMTVAVDGQLRYRWPVSTGATGFSTPVGSYTPFRMEVMHYSREWDNAGMPHAIFFTTRGHSIHGSDHPGLGTPVSHGCVRLTLSNHHALSARPGELSQTNVVRGPDPPGVTVPSQPPRQKRGWQPFRFF